MSSPSDKDDERLLLDAEVDAEKDPALANACLRDLSNRLVEVKAKLASAPSAMGLKVTPGRWYFIYESDSEADAKERRSNALAFGALKIGKAVSELRRADGTTKAP